MNRPVLIPVNDLARAKGRLAGLLSPEEREQLALITLQTVLHAAGPDAIVLTPDERIAGLVAGRARVLLESPKARGLNGQLEFALMSKEERANAPAHLRSIEIVPRPNTDEAVPAEETPGE